jgi:hypothetical protein
MIHTPMDVLTAFPVRKSGKQKQAFRDAVQTYARDLGYETTVEKGNGAHNVIIGNPDTAKYLVTAHYDTCARMIVPNLITPCNFFTFILYQLFVTGMIFAAAIAVGSAVGVLAKDAVLGRMVGYGVVWALLILMMVGPANKHNANDNTPGVVTVLEIARSMPEMHRDKVCFVLFDLEEVGTFGSAAYRQKHKKQSNDQIVLNLDCVGDGDEIVFFPRKKLCKDEQKLRHLCSCVGRYGEKSIAVKNKGFRIYPSDQTQFPYGVGIAAFHRKKWVGLYCARIHTPKDTVLELTNVNILRAAITSLISTDAA